MTWSYAAGDGSALWGRYSGSAAQPYQVTVRLAGPAYACSCPSRRRPCKHVVALMELGAAGRLPSADPPEWAAEWLRRAAEREQRREPAAPSRELADPEAAAKRAAARDERVANGMAELEQWVSDQLRGGLAAVERAGYPHVESIAARMVDAQAPGVAGMLRSIGAERPGEDRPARLLRQFAALHLLIQAHSRLAELPAGLAATVRSRIGYPVAKEDVLARPGLLDDWLCVGLIDETEVRLDTRRVWLYGQASGQWAVVLSFAPPGGALDESIVPGQTVRARLHRYPGAGTLRGLLADPTQVASGASPPVEAIDRVQRRYADLLAEDPWASRMPAVLAGTPMLPEERGRRWRLRAGTGECVELLELPADPWPMLARSLQGPPAIFGEWSAAGFRPVSLLPETAGGLPVPALAAAA